jgi:hypothetical protein
LVCGEPLVAAMRSKRIWIISDDIVAEELSKFRSQLHNDQRRARQL